MGTIVLLTRSAVMASNLALVRSMSMCRGAESFMVMKGRLIFVLVMPERSIFAFSAASLIRCIAAASFERSTPSFALNSATIQSIIFLSKSSPPNMVSPLVESTSNTPSSISRMETSNVPPPRS